MASWGDVNAALNRLVREGVITGFRTNISEPSSTLALHVVVTTDRALGDAGRLAARARVEERLERLVSGAVVTLDRSNGAEWGDESPARAWSSGRG
jgi:hypothetical protein